MTNVDALEAQAPRVFVSYSWDDQEHREWVHAFATQLRADGLDVTLDQWQVGFGDPLPEFMERAVRDNDYVLIICTPKYKERSDGRVGGVGYEGDIMTAEVFSTRRHRKFIPVLRKGDWYSALPSWLSAKKGADLRHDPYSKEQYRELIDALHGQTPEVPPLGRRPERDARNLVEDLARERGSTGPDVDELERESLARCAIRWQAVGLTSEEARTFADNTLVGSPAPPLREALRRPVAVVVGEFGSGKSLLLDRLLQRAIMRLREDPDAPLPVYIEAWEIEGRLRDIVLQKTSSLGDAKTRGAVVLVDGAEEAGRTQARRIVEDAGILAGTWPYTTVIVAGRPLPELTGGQEMIEMPKLTDEETKNLIEGLTGKELTFAITHSWPESVADAVRRPLFAVLLALNMRKHSLQNPRSTGELLSNLVARALAKSEDLVDIDQLRKLAVATIDSEGAPMRAAEVGTGEDVRRLRETGLVIEKNAMITFSLRILAEWFAAQLGAT